MQTASPAGPGAPRAGRQEVATIRRVTRIGPLWLLALLALALLLAACGRPPKPQGWAGPVLQDGTLYASIDHGHMAALEPQEGDQTSFVQRWSFPPKGEIEYRENGETLKEKLDLKGIYNPPIVEGGNVYFAGYDGNVYAVSAENGELVWDKWFDIGSHIIGGLAMADGTLFVGSDGGLLYGLKPADGTVAVGPFDAGDAIWSTPLVSDDGGTVYVATLGGKVFALDTSTLEVRWTFEAGAGLLTNPVLAGGNTILAGGIDTKLYAIDAASGEQRWSFKGGNWFWGTPVVDGGTVYAGNLDHKVYALGLDSGEKLWESSAEAPLRAAPLLVDGLVVVADEAGNIHGLDPANGQAKWKVPTELGTTVFADMMVFGNEVLVITRDEKLHAIAPEDGTPRLVGVTK